MSIARPWITTCFVAVTVRAIVLFAGLRCRSAAAPSFPPAPPPRPMLTGSLGASTSPEC